MLPFFPEAHPDELAFSIFARYHYLSGNISLKDTMIDLFGSKTACAVMDLPNRLNKLCDQFPPGSSITPEMLIQQNTLFPLYQPFLPPEKVKKIIKMMKSSTKGGSIHTTSGIMASGISMSRYLKICPQCLCEDEKRFGESYWHRVHQIPGMFICPIHQRWLKETKIAVSSPYNKHAFYLFNPGCINLDVCFEIFHSAEMYLKVARAIYWILNHSIQPKGLSVLRAHYMALLIQKGLATYSGRVKQRDLLQEFTSYYSKEFLGQFNCLVLNSPDNWLSKMVRKPRTSAHPLRHVLLMTFLGITPEEFFGNSSSVELPFGKGPWPCLNPASDHYHMNIIKEVVISRDSKLTMPVGTFQCTCGFIYSRRGPDRNDRDRYRIGRIKAFGQVWLRRLAELSNRPELSLREIARRLNVDPGTIKNQRNKLPKHQNKEFNPDFELIKAKYRNYWLRVFLSNPNKCRTALRFLAYAEYSWLYRHDREWLHAHLPAKKVLNRSFQRVNWVQRDEEISQKVLFITRRLKKKAGKPVRITLSLMGKELGQQMLMQKHLSKLEKTSSVLKDICETTEEFQYRRVVYIIKRLQEDGERVVPWKVIKLAGLRPGYSKMVESTISTSIEKEMNVNETEIYIF